LRRHVPCCYGVVEPMTSCIPLRVEFDQWMRLARDRGPARTRRAVLGGLPMLPGWKAAA
jgi:hypothetical protein